MSNQPPKASVETRTTVTSVQWSQILEFTHLFKGFRLAINPAKIFIALLAILAIYVSGRLFDVAWGPQVYVNEIETYQSSKAVFYDFVRQNQNRSRTQELRDRMESTLMGQTPALKPEEIQSEAKYYSEHPRSAYRKLSAAYQGRFHESLDHARTERLTLEKLASATQSSFSLPGTKPLDPAQAEQAERQRAATLLQAQMTALGNTVGSGIFDAFLRYEVKQFDALVENTLTFVRVSPVRSNVRGSSDLGLMDEQALSGGLISKNPSRLWRSDTVVGCLANLTLTGPMWLASGTAPMQWRAEPAAPTAGFLGRLWPSVVTYSYRGFYLLTLLVLLAFWLVVIAFCGAAICRLSALEFSGQDQPSLIHVLRFARSKFWDFIRAPLIPFAILLVLGLALAVLGLIGAIPFLGELLLGIAFIAFLAVGFLMMLIVLGIIGGFNLLYPTIAVEGSDSFDAISRSFAYVYARPWRLLAYTIISLVYGIITFLFVTFALYLILAMTHAFTSWGTSLFGYNDAWYAGVPKLDALWPAPEVNNLTNPVNWWALSWTEYLGALALHFWVYLLVAALGGYVISFYYSIHTIIYFLLRRSVDGQSLSEVSSEEAVVSQSLSES